VVGSCRHCVQKDVEGVDTVHCVQKDVEPASALFICSVVVATGGPSAASLVGLARVSTPMQESVCVECSGRRF
jgi:hypothetical protein